MKLIYFLISGLIFISCSQNSKLKNILSEDQLASQIFRINVNQDTTLITAGGCILKIPKGSLRSDSINVKLEIKEALTVTDIVLAGMTTQSNNQALSSGGMIYFNAASGYNITITKPLEVLVPSNNYNRDMKVYKGEEDQNNKLNWANPVDLPIDSTTMKIDEGNSIFKANCTSCHKIYEDFAGPALYGVTDRRSKKWLYNYTRHSVEMTFGKSAFRDSAFSKDAYAICLKNQYGGVVMTSFPNLTDYDLDGIYSYIKSESDKRPDLKSVYQKNCCDSCEIYGSAIKNLTKKKEELIKDNGDFFNLERSVPLPQTIVLPDSGNYSPATPPPYSKVTPVSANAVYYTINISATGWYNIDILLKEYSACQPSELFVRIQGTYKIDLNIVLVIPSIKLFVEGGKMKNDEQYGFDQDNGKMPLLMDTKAYIMAFGEYNNQIIFGTKSFQTQKIQTIDIVVVETTKEKMVAEIKALNLDGINTKVEKSKNAEEILKANKAIKEFEDLKPKDCNCDLDFGNSPETTPLNKNH